MKAMVIKNAINIAPDVRPLELLELECPSPKESEVLINVKTCGVCHTELDEIEGRTPPAFYPMIPGHQVVGEVIEVGTGVTLHEIGERVGVAWIFDACGQCGFCQTGQENLCPQFRATGRDMPGGYAEYMKVHEAFAYHIPDNLSDLEAAPLLCAGSIGYRALRLSGFENGHSIGLTGFGASAHLVLKMVIHKYPKSKIYVFARSKHERDFAKQLGAVWSGDTTDDPPVLLDVIIDTTPVWKPIVEGLKHLKPAGRLVVNAIRKEKSDQQILMDLDYSKHLWMEKEIKSVANITRADVKEFLDLASQIPILPQVQEYLLDDANQALIDLKFGYVKGAKVLRVST